MTDPLVTLGIRCREVAVELGVEMAQFTVDPNLDGDAHTVRVIFLLPELEEPADEEEEVAALMASIEAHESLSLREGGGHVSRAELIKTRLDDHFMKEVEAAVSTPDAELWRTLVDQLGPQAMFGWSWPIAHDDPPILVPYCPEIIDEQTADLNETDFVSYLEIIEWVVDTHITMWETESDPVVRTALIEDELGEQFPSKLNVWMQVRLAVLDRMATP